MSKASLVTDTTQDTRHRIASVVRDLTSREWSTLVVTPGASLRYLTGYAGDPATERITALVIGADGSARMLVPRMEKSLADVEIVPGLDVELIAWAETDDPLAQLAALLPDGPCRVGVEDRMWAGRSLGLRALRPDADQVSAAVLLESLRVRKSDAEIAALRRAADAIDSVHAEMAQWLQPGRTEREIGVDIAAAIVSAGHARTEFVIVASGPNAASPHAMVSDRVVTAGDPVVVDIGGSMPDGYCSDSTRTYAVGDPPDAFARSYQVLLSAQLAQCDAVRPGISGHDLDAIGRQIISDAGYGECFLHRTGHGIGLDVHERPYITPGNDMTLQPGMAFSIEPGIYQDGLYGARIEDIVICGESAGERLNRRPRELTVLS
jgi:Xaa-Pro aminopeptidase